MAKKVGHDLVLEVGSWAAGIDPGDAAVAVSLCADPRSLRVLSGAGGIKPLSDKDRDEIRRNIDAKVLRGKPIEFRGTVARSREDDTALAVEGELTIAGATRPLAARLRLDADGRVTGTVPILQSRWGITPFRGLLGALRVRDDVEVVIDARLPAA